MQCPSTCAHLVLEETHLGRIDDLRIDIDFASEKYKHPEHAHTKQVVVQVRLRVLASTDNVLFLNKLVLCDLVLIKIRDFDFR